MVVATLMFCLSDTLMKLAGGVLPATETTFVRSLIATIAVGSAAPLRTWRWLRMTLPGGMVLRAGADACASLLFQSALPRMLFADIQAVNLLQTLSLTAGSALFLGEAVGWRRWSAVAAGLIGGLLIIKPGTSAFNWWAIAAFGAVMLVAVREIATRKILSIMPVPVIITLSSAAVTLASLAGSFFQTWSIPSKSELAMMVGAGFFSLAAQYCTISAIRSAELSVVSPFRYVTMIWALILGFVIWGDIPDDLSLWGIFVISAAGLYTFHRERTLRIRREGLGA